MRHDHRTSSLDVVQAKSSDRSRPTIPVNRVPALVLVAVKELKRWRIRRRGATRSVRLRIDLAHGAVTGRPCRAETLGGGEVANSGPRRITHSRRFLMNHQRPAAAKFTLRPVEAHILQARHDDPIRATRPDRSSFHVPSSEELGDISSTSNGSLSPCEEILHRSSTTSATASTERHQISATTIQRTHTSGHRRHPPPAAAARHGSS